MKLTLAQWIARFTKGYIKATGKEPDGLAKLKIKMEAAQRVKDQGKVVDITSKIKDDWWKQRSGFIRQHPEATKKIKEVTPIKKNLSDDEATSQINKLREDFDFTDRSKVLQLLDDIDAGKAYGAFDDVQKKELRDMISTMYTRKPEFASGGIARVGMMIGGFTKAQVLIQMMKNTLKGSKDAYVKKTFPNFIKELQKNPELALDPNVWKQFTTGLPKNQRLVVHSDDSVDFFTQSKFGPHNIEKTLEFQKKHNLSRDQANKILQMEPEDRVLEMKRLETIADRSRTKQAAGGIAGELHLHRPGYESGREVLPQQEIYEEELEKRGGFTGDPLYYFLGPGIETLKYKWPRSLLKKMIDDYKDIPKERLPEDFGPGLGSGVNVDTPLRRYRKKKLPPMIRRKKRKTIEQEAAEGGLAKVLGV